jgi:hypothetical protein
VKSYYRLGLALFELGRPVEALSVLNQGLVLEPSNTQLRSLKAKAAENKSSKAAVSKGFLLRDGGHDVTLCAPNCTHVEKINGSICQTCVPAKSRTRKTKSAQEASKAMLSELTASELTMFNELKSTVKKIKAGDYDFGVMGGGGMMQGTFACLLDSSTFQSFIFPGSPADVLEVLPKNLKQLLVWEPIELDLIKITKQAVNVLEGVKKRGASTGDTMDSRTEAILRPQVVQEALARELVSAVKKVSKLLSNWKAKTTLTIADAGSKVRIFGDAADNDSVLLDESCVENFPGIPYFSQPELMGNGWSGAALHDVVRYCRTQTMSPMSAWKVADGDILPRIAWIEKDSVSSLFPALAEVLNQLQYLPFELNGNVNTTSLF